MPDGRRSTARGKPRAAVSHEPWATAISWPRAMNPLQTTWIGNGVLYAAEWPCCHDPLRLGLCFEDLSPRPHAVGATTLPTRRRTSTTTARTRSSAAAHARAPPCRWRRARVPISLFSANSTGRVGWLARLLKLNSNFANSTGRVGWLARLLIKMVEAEF